VRRLGGSPKGAAQREGVTSEMVSRTERSGQVGMSGLMVAEAMTETLVAESSHGAGKTPKHPPATPR
jgi:hypothetical protein